MSLQGHWADLPSSAFRELPGDLVAVLPLGAIEQHGPHLPVSVDRDLIEAAVAAMLGELGPEQSVLALPVLSVTKSNEHLSFPGTLTLGPETLLAVLRDIGASLARTGVRRLVLFNGHGGNTALLQVAARELRVANRMIVAVCGWFGFAETEGLISAEAYARDIHAGDLETSAMLAVKPALVNMAEARDFVTSLDRWEAEFDWIGLSGQAASPAWVIEDLNPEGACGNAALATAEKGRALIESAGRNFAAFLREFAQFDLGGGA